VYQDIKLANELGAVADYKGVENTHGIDLAIGGHDHIYYVGRYVWVAVDHWVADRERSDFLGRIRWTARCPGYRS
jgi:hypothetical protein